MAVMVRAIKTAMDASLKRFEGRLKEIENILIDTAVQTSKAPKATNGKDGAQGQDGKPGKSIVGAKGEQGLPGFDGRDGREGVDGEPGAKGAQGDKGKDGKDGVTRHTYSNTGNSILHAGEIGRLSSVTSVVDSDDFAILRNGALFRVTAEVLAAYIVTENTTVTEITFADSPYSILTTDERIYVDSTDGNVVVNLISRASAPLKAIHIQKTVAPNTVTITAAGSDTINGAATKAITSTDVDHELVPASEWRLS